MSIGSFGLPLHKLLMAIRRKASNIIRDAYDMNAVSRGRFAAAADMIDIQVERLVKSSSGIEGLVVMQHPPPGAQFSMFMDGLPCQATEQTLDAIDKERRGVHCDSGARKFLESLPEDITRQEFTLTVDGEIRRKVSFGQVDLPEPITELPYLTETVGKVIGVGFEPGRNLVHAKGQDGDVKMDSDPENVSRALQARDTEVRFLDVRTGGQRRLLRIDGPSQPRPVLDIEEFVFEKWRSVIEALAK